MGDIRNITVWFWLALFKGIIYIFNTEKGNIHYHLHDTSFHDTCCLNCIQTTDLVVFKKTILWTYQPSFSVEKVQCPCIVFCWLVCLGTNTTGAMASITRSQPSCQLLSTLACWWNGWKPRSTMRSSFLSLLVGISWWCNISVCHLGELEQDFINKQGL